MIDVQPIVVNSRWLNGFVVDLNNIISEYFLYYPVKV